MHENLTSPSKPLTLSETNRQSEEAQLQTAADALFSARAARIGGDGLGRILFGARNISSRDNDDITKLESYFIPADTSKTDAAVTRYRRLVGNADETGEAFDEIITKHTLLNYDQLMVVAPHTKLLDLVGILHASFCSELLTENRNASDNYLPLGRMLGYAEFGLPRFRKPVVEQFLTPVTNIIQVFPETNSTLSLRAAYPEPIRKANIRANLAGRKDQRLKVKPPLQLTGIAPSGTEMKPYLDGKQLPPIALSTIDLMYNAMSKNETPILFAGFELDVLRATIPPRRLIPIKKELARLAFAEPIMPGQNMSKEEFSRLIIEGLLSVARAVSQVRIYS